MPRKAKDVVGEQVPKYMITDDQKAWISNFKKLRSVQLLLETQSLKTQEKLQTLKGAWEELSKEMIELQRRMPSEQIKELSGMNFVTSEEEASRYQIKY